MDDVIKGIKSLKGSVVIASGLALALEGCGLINNALNIINIAINKSPNSRELHLHACRLFLKRGQVDKAVMHWKKAAGPENIGSFLHWLDRHKKIKKQAQLVDPDLISQTDSFCPIKTSSKECALNDVGLGLLERGHPHEALAIFEQDLQSSKNDPALLFNIGLCYSKLEMHHESLNFYTRAQKEGLNSLELLNNKGYSLFCLNLFEEALTCYELARGLAPTDYTILNNLAACYLKTNQLNKAEGCLRAAVTNNPTDAAPLNNLAMCLENYGRYHEALKYYDKAIKLEQNTQTQKHILQNKVNCLVKLNQPEEALLICKTLVDTYRHDYELWGLQANLQHQLGKTKEAADSYRRALGLPG